MLAVFFHATIFLVALVGLAHIWLPVVADYKWVIEKEVSDFVGNPVTIESIAVDWQSEAPRWVLNNLQLYDEHGGAQIAVEKLYLTLDRRESLRTVRLQPRDVRVENVTFRVVQQSAGNFTVPGLVFPLPGQSNLQLGTTRETPIALTVAGGAVRWQAENDTREVVLSDVQFDGLFDTREISLKLGARFPTGVGKTLQLNSRLEEVSSGVWNGDVEVQTDIDQLAALPLRHVQAIGITDAGLHANGELTLRNNKPVSAQGSLALIAPQFIQAKLPLAPLERLSLEGSVNANSDDVWLGDLYVVHKQKQEHKQQSDAERSHIGFGILRKNQQLHLDASLDRVDLAHYFPLLARQPWMPEAWRDALGQMQPQGRLDKTDVALVIDEQARALQRYRASGTLTGLSFKESAQFPGLKAVDADFRFDEQQGTVNVAVTEGTVRFRRWFAKDIALSVLRFGLDWKQAAAASWELTLRDLALKNRDVKIDGGGKARFGKQRDPDVALELAFASRRLIDNVRDYIPKITPAATKAWLEEGIVQGYVPEGSLKLWGNPLAYPFDKKGTGGLDIRFRAEQGILRYLPGWPVATEVAGNLRFLNRTMSADVKHGRIGDVQVSGGHVFIDHMGSGDSDLTLALTSQGALPGYFDYLQKIPPTQGAKRFIQAAQFGGQAGLTLNVATPLVSERFAQLGVDVRGAVQLQQADFAIPEYGQRFSAMKGVVHFDRYGVNAEQVQAVYQGQPLAVQAKTSEDRQTIRVSLQQRNQAQQVLPATLKQLGRAVGRFVQGESHIKADLTVPSFVAAQRTKGSDHHDAVPLRLQLRAHSDLVGAAVHLPAPFGKSAEEKRSFQLDMSMPLQADGVWHTRIDYGEHLNIVHAHSAANAVSRPVSRTAPLRLGVVLGDVPATLPESGVTVFGRLPVLDSVAWTDTWSHVAAALPAAQKQAFPALLADVTIAQLSAGDAVQLGHSRIRADTRKGLTFNVQSPKAQLAVNNSVSTQLNQDAQVAIKLNNIDFKALETGWQQLQSKRPGQAQGAAAAMPLPETFPVVSVVCTQCRWGRLPVDRLRLALQRGEREGSAAIRAEMRLKALELQSGYLRLLADGGVWRRLAPGHPQSRTSLSASLQIEKPGAFLKTLGVDAGLTGGFLQADGQLAWQGAPFAFNARSLEGDVHVTLGAGALTDVEPGMGRLLGLLDVQRLPRRLSGGFSDMTSKGMQFDSMKGDLQIKGGKMHSRNVVIRSPVMVAGIKGESDLIARTHNQRVTVIPKLESTVPVIGAVLGGVGVGAALALVNAVRKEAPERKLQNENSAFALRYRVTGAWKAPQIDEVKRTPQQGDVDVFSE